jgi:hypothetical protein
MMVHTCNTSTWELGAEDYEFKASLGYIVSPYQKKKERNKQKGNRYTRIYIPIITIINSLNSLVLT